VKNLSRDSDGSLNPQLLVLGSLHQIRTNWNIQAKLNNHKVCWSQWMSVYNTSSVLHGAACSITCDQNTICLMIQDTKAAQSIQHTWPTDWNDPQQLKFRRTSDRRTVIIGIGC
jgi:hypothetical protein